MLTECDVFGHRYLAYYRQDMNESGVFIRIRYLTSQWLDMYTDLVPARDEEATKTMNTQEYYKQREGANVAKKREVVKFNGQPVEVTLKYAVGKQCSNGSYLYTLLNDDRALFAPPALNWSIQKVNPYAGIRVSIQALSNDKWEVKAVGPVQEPLTPPASGPAFAAPASSEAGLQTTQTNPITNGKTKEQLMTELGQVLVN